MTGPAESSESSGPTRSIGSSEGLRARLVVARGSFALDLPLEVSPGRVLGVLGPNGAGKSTALAALAGLVPLAGGRVELDGEVLDDPAAGTWVPPRRRGVGVVFQDYLLFPHLDAAENVAFGPRSQGWRRGVARERAAAELDRVGLADHARSYPGELSGGQAQRVALARALAPDPGLLLLDEPLAALDAGTRQEVRSTLRSRLAGYPGCTVLVTHDPLDAMVLADDLLVVEGGRVVQSGPPATVAAAPRSAYVASLVGLNLYRGRADGTTVLLDGGGTLTGHDAAEGPVFVAVAPSAVALHRHRPDGSPRNTWPGTVLGLEHHGSTVRVRVDGVPPVLADVTPAAVADLGLAVGEPVWAAVKATEVATYPA